MSGTSEEAKPEKVCVRVCGAHRRWCLGVFCVQSSGAERWCSPGLRTPISATYLLSFPGEPVQAARAHRRLSRSFICSSIAAVDLTWPDPLVTDIPTCMSCCVLLTAGVLCCGSASVRRMKHRLPRRQQARTTPRPRPRRSRSANVCSVEVRLFRPPSLRNACVHQASTWNCWM